MPSRTLPEGSSLFGYVLVFDSMAEQVLRMMLRTCCALAEAPSSSGNPCWRVTLRIHRGVRVCQGKPDPETISGSRIFGAGSHSKGAKIRQIAHNRPFLSARLAEDGFGSSGNLLCRVQRTIASSLWRLRSNDVIG